MNNQAKSSSRYSRLIVCMIAFFITWEYAVEKLGKVNNVSAISYVSQKQKKSPPEVAILLRDGQKALNAGRLDDSLRLLNEALSVARRLGDRVGESTALNNLADLFVALGKPQKSLEYLKEALLACRANEDKACEAGTLTNVGAIYYHLKQRSEALESLEQALKLWEDIDTELGKSSAAFTKRLIDKVKREIK